MKPKPKTKEQQAADHSHTENAKNVLVSAALEFQDELCSDGQFDPGMVWARTYVRLIEAAERYKAAIDRQSRLLVSKEFPKGEDGRTIFDDITLEREYKQ